MRVSSADNAISFDASVSDLTSDVAVAQTDDETILRRIVFVLILEDKTLASLVISSSFAAPLEFDLVPLEVLLVFNDFDESHLLISYVPLMNRFSLN